MREVRVRQLKISVTEIDAMRHTGEQDMAIRPLRVGGALMIVGFVVAGCTSSHHAAEPLSRTPGSPAASTSVETPSGAADPSGSPKSSGVPKSSGKAAPKSSPPTGVEAPTVGVAGACKITSTRDVEASYHGKVTAESSGTSGIGNPLCRFTIANTDGGAPGRISITLNASIKPATFATVKKQSAGASPVSGIGDDAFYTATGTLQFIKGYSVVVIQAALAVPGGAPPKPSQMKADTITLARTIAADL
jgi:hypothetical protein